MPSALSTSYNSTMTPSSSVMEKDTMAPPVSGSSTANWEEMEYGGLSLSGLPGGAPMPVVVKNTFINYPNLRSPSLDEVAQENARGWTSCPASRMVSMDGDMQASGILSEIQASAIKEALTEAASSSRGGSADDAASTTCPTEQLDNDEQQKEDKEQPVGDLPEGVVVKNTFIDLPNVRSTSLDEYMENNWGGWKSCPVSRMQSEVENQISEIQALVIKEEEQQEEEKPEEEKTTLRLLELLPSQPPAQQQQHPAVFSQGSVPHSLGQPCKPCGFVHKPEGCSNGANCQYCHLCPPGTIKQRKKVKKVMIRNAWQNRQHQAATTGWY